MKKEIADHLQLHFQSPYEEKNTKCEILQVDELTNSTTSKLIK